jgi:hypothetical protein
MKGIDGDLVNSLWLYANRASEHAGNLIPQGGRSAGVSAGPLMAVEMIGECMRTAMLGLALSSLEGIGDIEAIPRSLFLMARALEKTGVRDFSSSDVEAILMVDRIISAGLERHLIAPEVCASAYSHAQAPAWRLVEDLRTRKETYNGTEG